MTDLLEAFAVSPEAHMIMHAIMGIAAVALPLSIWLMDRTSTETRAFAYLGYAGIAVFVLVAVTFSVIEADRFNRLAQVQSSRR